VRITQRSISPSSSSLTTASASPTLADLEAATAWWVSWFNHRRLYGPLGDILPAEYEQNWQDGQMP
jgi:transposase InsO family protein